MSNIEILYQNALMADASYIDFDVFSGAEGNVNENSSLLVSAFIARGFTEKQVQIFFETYDVKYFQPNTASGFSAVVFEEAATGKRTVAFRGTEPPPSVPLETFIQDLVQDIKLAFGRSTLVDNSQHNFTESFFYAAGLIDENGNPAAGNEGNVNFIGHSLGGYLALMAAYDFPQLFDDVFTYNGAGITGLDWFWVDVVRPFLGIVDPVDENRIFNYYSDAGLEVTAGQMDDGDLSVFARPGSTVHRKCR